MERVNAEQFEEVCEEMRDAIGKIISKRTVPSIVVIMTSHFLSRIVKDGCLTSHGRQGSSAL